MKTCLNKNMNDRWIEKFQREVLPVLVEECEPERVIIFGSRARGVARKTSDIDVIVVASYFANIPFLKRMPLLLRMAPFSKHIDYICYTPGEFERVKDSSSVIKDALKDAVEAVELQFEIV